MIPDKELTFEAELYKKATGSHMLRVTISSIFIPSSSLSSDLPQDNSQSSDIRNQ
jgi:hypothetical protein